MAAHSTSHHIHWLLPMDGAARIKQLLRVLLRTHLRGLINLQPTLLLLMVTTIILTALHPLKVLYPNKCYELSSKFILPVWNWLQYLFEKHNGATITFSGDDLPPGESAIVIANHIAWADYFLIQALAKKASMLGRTRWFAKKELQAVPILGWGLVAMGMPMVSRRWEADRLVVKCFLDNIVKGKWPIWLVIFAEATRLVPEKRLKSMQWCERHGKPQPKHLLYPRTKGFTTVVQRLREAAHIKAVYDLTVAYQRGRDWLVAPNFWHALSGPHLSEPEERGGGGYRFHVHSRRYPIEELPRDEAGLAKWLERRWLEKGEWLEKKRIQWAVEGQRAADMAGSAPCPSEELGKQCN